MEIQETGSNQNQCNSKNNSFFKALYPGRLMNIHVLDTPNTEKACGSNGLALTDESLSRLWKSFLRKEAMMQVFGSYGIIRQ